MKYSSVFSLMYSLNRSWNIVSSSGFRRYFMFSSRIFLDISSYFLLIAFAIAIRSGFSGNNATSFSIVFVGLIV